ncbi:GNAT family N-acetyltransferase [Devosia sp.]|uniref:GNAT family N-acetyltransferase n=1 Tax=Devosia sp. TaxID=1871048 RepID=UPI003A8F579F
MSPEIRSFATADTDQLYAISLATGDLGGDASHLYDDAKLMGHVYAGAYAALEPALILVLVDDIGVSGFALGVPDTAGWELRLEREWWPPLRAYYSDPIDYPEPERTPDQRRANMIHHPRMTPSEVSDAYPAHLHLNLLPRAQGRGWGTRLMRSWLLLAADQCAEAVHVGANRGNERAVAFWRRSGFSPVLEQGSTIWLGLKMAQTP